MLLDDILVAEREHNKFDISLNHWRRPKPHGLSGCFRLKNEEEFMVRAVESHLPWLDEAVLMLQDSEDRTLEVAHELKNRWGDKIRIEHYPFVVHPSNTPGHFSLPENSVYTMMHLTNWAIYKCNYSWIAKIEGDVIALSTFSKIRDAVDKEPDAVRHYGRIGLNIAGEHYDQISYTNPRNAGWDESVFNNDPFWYCVRYGKWQSINMKEHRDKLINKGFSFLHTKRCKEGLSDPYSCFQAGRLPEIEKWVPFDRDHTREALKVHNAVRPHPGPDDFCPDVLFEATILDEYK